MFLISLELLRITETAGENRNAGHYNEIYEINLSTLDPTDIAVIL